MSIQVEDIVNLRKKYSDELKKHDKEALVDGHAEIILKAKIVAIGEVLDLVGYKEEDIWEY